MLFMFVVNWPCLGTLQGRRQQLRNGQAACAMRACAYKNEARAESRMKIDE